MTPLEFQIAAKNADATQAVDSFAQKVGALKQQTDSFYQGPAREMRIRTEIRGMIQDIAMGQNPIQATIGTMERLSEVARFALPAAVLVTGLAAIAKAEYDAYVGALKYTEAYKKAMSGGDVGNLALTQLNEVVKACKDAEEEYAKMPFLQRIVVGLGGGYSANLATKAREAMARSEIDSIETTRIQAHTDALRVMKDAELARQGEIEEARLELQQKADDEREKGNEDAAKAYEDQMGAAMDRINEKYQRQLEEQANKRHETWLRLQDEIDDAQEALLDPATQLQDKKAKRYNLQQFVAASEQENPNDPAKMEAREKARLEILRLTKEINDDEARQKKAADDKTTQAADKAKTAAEELARLKHEANAAEFENLTKAEKVVALRKEVTQLEGLMNTQVGLGDSPLYETMRKALAGAVKDLRTLDVHENPWAGESALTALTHQGTAQSWSMISNDKAHRAEAQRAEMVKQLTRLADRNASPWAVPF
jgi:hypothetical protein